MVAHWRKVMLNMFRRFGVLALLALLAPVCAPSVALAQRAPDWTGKVKLGKPLFVTLDDGVRVEGTAGSVNGEGLVVATPVGVRTVMFRDIRKVERRDSLWNGVWIGAAVGGALGLSVMLDDSTCPNRTSGCRSEVAAAPMVGAVYGALVGWGIDALVKGRTTIFNGDQGPRLSVAAAPGGVSARLTVGW